MGKDRVIGKDNGLPWHLPADLKRFKAITMGHPIIMGRKTYESIGKPLPGRNNIVVTRNPDFAAAGCTVVSSIDRALDAATGYDEAFCIGGAELFKEILPRADKVYLTLIDETFSGDVFFPELVEDEWIEVASEYHVPDEKNKFAYRYVVLTRKRK